MTTKRIIVGDLDAPVVRGTIYVNGQEVNTVEEMEEALKELETFLVKNSGTSRDD